MHLSVVLMIACLCVSTIALYLPGHKRQMTLINNHRRIAPVDDVEHRSSDVIKRRSKRSFVKYDECPEGEKRLPSPLNKCVPIAVYEEYITEDDYGDGINSA